MRHRMHSTSTDIGIAGGALLGGMILGAGLMAIFDPQRGRTRRAFAGQKMRHFSRIAGERIEGRKKDLSNRTRGLITEARSRMNRHEEPISDNQLEARVRSRMGHIVSHPGAVEVAACDGCVVLAGEILASEADSLVQTVRSTPGVLAIEDDLNRFTDSSHVPSLQGGREFRGRIGRRGMSVASGISSLSLVASGLALYGISRILDLDLRGIMDRGMSAFQSGSMEDVDMDFEEDIDAMERTGCPPGWTEAGTTIGLDRVR